MYNCLSWRSGRIENELKKYPSKSNIEIVHADDNIAMSEHPVEAVRGKKNCSINVGMRLVKDVKQMLLFLLVIRAVMASALFTLGRIKGIERPVLHPFPYSQRPDGYSGYGAIRTTNRALSAICLYG
jgi:fatty acid/phospholipid biosynthesis enzyme